MGVLVVREGTRLGAALDPQTHLADRFTHSRQLVRLVRLRTRPLVTRFGIRSVNILPCAGSSSFGTYA